MAVEVLLPKLSFSMDEGKLVDWLVANGESVAEGAPLYEIESEKAVQEVESPASGVLRIQVAAGETVAIGTVLAVIE